MTQPEYRKQRSEYRRIEWSYKGLQDERLSKATHIAFRQRLGVIPAG
ncbi:hypothetical protein [Porphyromonas sp.]